MPKRTRQHVLEEESWKHFNSCIPDKWVVRKPSPDYGLDAEVEIFSDDGSSTGLICLVQIKATDIDALDKALKLRFEKDKIRYYSSLQLPVLIVRYHSPSKTQYYLWAHSIDLYYTKPDSKTFTISFPESNRWNSTTPSEIQDYLVQLRRVTGGHYELPAQLLFEYGIDFDDMALPLRLESTFIHLVKEQQVPVKLVNKGETKYPTKLKISKDEIRISFLEQRGLILHNVQDRKGAYSEKELPYDLLTIVGLYAFVLGQKNVGIAILKRNFPFSSLKYSDAFLGLLKTILLDEKRLDICVSILETLFKGDYKDRFALFNRFYMYVVAPITLTHDLDTDIEEKLTNVVVGFCNYCENMGEVKVASSHYYSLGNLLRKSPNTSDKKVFSYYRKAAKLDPTYLTRDYFWAEMAGVLFHLSKYSWAANFYKRSLNLKERVDIIALYADSLLFAGCYQESLDAFKEYLKKEEKPHAEWVMKLHMLEVLLKTFGLKAQKRKPEEASKIADIDPGEAIASKESAKKAIETMKDAINKDMLCAPAWYHLAHLHYFHEEFEDSFFSFSVSCLLAPGNVDAWIPCIFCGAQIRAPQLGSMVFLAYEKNGEKLMNTLTERLRSLPEPMDQETVQVLKEVFAEVRKHYDQHKREEPRLIRLLNGEGKYHEIPIGMK